ncbi:MAG: response regulator transcription factor [Mogibacterium sp.]|nr:response regulator transcription factor [Mogibacterium sp.]MBR2540479.1 response regulator transcription factor [Mogibacterium sp.]
MRLLLAEDEVALARAVVKIFEKNNYSIDAVHDGEEALDYLEAGNYDAAILDIMMPKMDGITVLRKLRASGSNLPVLMLTAKAEIDDKVLGLDSGANYYLTKPFDSKELLAAVRAITRSQTEVDTKLAVGNITLDRQTFELSSPSGSVRLANKEFQMLEMMMSSPKNVFSVDSFMDRIWGYDTDTESNVVWVYISYIRKKLSALGANVKIKASRNAGYSLEVAEE